jgi:alkylation response protein AidB-like acyl-CoA dehydrogenase
MEALFERSIHDLEEIYRFSEEDYRLFEAVDRAADELLPIEFEEYLARNFNRRAIEVLKRYGLLGIPISREYGGWGALPLPSTLAMERLGQVGLGMGTIIGAHVTLGEMSLQLWGTEEQKERYLKPAVKGEKILAYALTEPEVGSDPMSLKTSFEERDGHYVLNGTKYLVSNGSVADAVITFAYPRGQTSGMTAFIVDTSSEGFEVAMKLNEKLGLYTSDTAMLQYNDVKVPKENVLGPMGKGHWVAFTALINGRLGVAAGCVGVIEDCLNAVMERAKTRWQHGKPIGKHQLIQKHIAEIAVALEAARWPTYYTALKLTRWMNDPFNEKLRQEVDQSTAIAKRLASRLAFEVADRAVQVFGGFGYSLLSPVGRHFLDTRVTRIYEGTDEIMDLKIAAGVLGREFEAYR